MLLLGEIDDNPCFEKKWSDYGYDYTFFSGAVLSNYRKDPRFIAYPDDKIFSFVVTASMRSHNISAYYKPPCLCFHKERGLCLIVAARITILDELYQGQKSISLNHVSSDMLEYPPEGFSCAISNSMLRL